MADDKYIFAFVLSSLSSFGLIAYELITEKPAFASPPIIDALAGRPIARPRLPDGAVADASAAILMRCLETDPTARPTATEIAAVLRPC